MLELRDAKLRLGAKPVLTGVDICLGDGPYSLGLVGESGAGKSTIGRVMARLLSLDEGELRLDSTDVTRATGRSLREFRRNVQIVFQDVDGVLNPRMKVGSALKEVLKVHRRARDRAALDDLAHSLLDEVGLKWELADRLPHQLSGGQRQRISIARALAVSPRFVILDEPTSALDVSVQARVLDLLERLRDRRNLSYLLITHNIAIAQRICEDCAVINDGSIVEKGRSTEVLVAPRDAYTRTLLASVPDLHKRSPTTAASVHGDQYPGSGRG